MKTIDLKKLTDLLEKNKYIWIMLVLGLCLLLLPRHSDRTSEIHSDQTALSAGIGDDLPSSGIPLDTESQRLAELLEKIDGVGNAAVLLSGEGAVVVCSGGNLPGARLSVTNAVSAYTGLGSDKITVMKMK